MGTSWVERDAPLGGDGDCGICSGSASPLQTLGELNGLLQGLAGILEELAVIQPAQHNATGHAAVEVVLDVLEGKLSVPDQHEAGASQASALPEQLNC
jgi:hypothetical protein